MLTQAAKSIQVRESDLREIMARFQRHRESVADAVGRLSELNAALGSACSDESCEPCGDAAKPIGTLGDMRQCADTTGRHIRTIHAEIDRLFKAVG